MKNKEELNSQIEAFYIREPNDNAAESAIVKYAKSILPHSKTFFENDVNLPYFAFCLYAFSRFPKGVKRIPNNLRGEELYEFVKEKKLFQIEKDFKPFWDDAIGKNRQKLLGCLDNVFELQLEKTLQKEETPTYTENEQ